MDASNQKGARITALAISSVIAILLSTSVLAYAGNTAFSPYTYDVYANGTTFTNDHRAKTTSSPIGVNPETTGYYVSPNAFVPQTNTAIHCGTRTYVNWTGVEQTITNYINEQGYSYAKLAFDTGGASKKTCKGLWRPDTRD